MVTGLEFHHRYNQLAKAFDLLEKYHNGRVLDVGCGHGLLEKCFAKLNVIGIDISHASLQEAKKIAPHGRFLLADMRFIPIKTESVGTVAMIACLGGLPPGEETMALKEAHRVLNSDGHLLILVSQNHRIYSRLAPDRLLGGWKWQHFNYEPLREHLINNGFEIREVVFVGGVLSLTINIFHNVWVFFWKRISDRLIQKPKVPNLPWQLLNRIEGMEFHPFNNKYRQFARFFYIIAQKRA